MLIFARDDARHVCGAECWSSAFLKAVALGSGLAGSKR